jgi:GxxExxY protein
MAKLLYEEQTYKILGACFEVYKEKGCGFHEPVYQECLDLEFRMQQIPAIPKPRLALAYKGRPLVQTFEPDFVCYSNIVVELKALSSLCDEHEAQVLNYLKSGNFPLGMLVNFGHHPRLEHIRLLASDKWRPDSAEAPNLQA